MLGLKLSKILNFTFDTDFIFDIHSTFYNVKKSSHIAILTSVIFIYIMILINLCFIMFDIKVASFHVKLCRD